jgi:predicted SprT family Zn-dependent metalloprotease
MAKGITYFCIDSDGNEYTRYSAGHTKQQYFYAVICRGQGTDAATKHGVSYASRIDLAHAAQNSRAAYYTKTEIARVTGIPGRHTTPPIVTPEPVEPAQELPAPFTPPVEPLAPQVEMERELAKHGLTVEQAVEAVNEAAGKALEAVIARDLGDEPVKHTATVYGELQAAFDFFNARLFDNRLRHVVFTVKTKPRNLGHYASDRFVSRDALAKSDEIAMNPIAMGRRPVADTLSTIVHEMVHLAQEMFGKPGKGAHHNKEWGAMMKEIGLYPSSTGEPGGKETGNKVSHYVIQGGRFDVACRELLATGYGLTWADGGAYDRSKEGSKQGKRVKYVCPCCELAAWARHGAALVCGDCSEPLVAQ